MTGRELALTETTAATPSTRTGVSLSEPFRVLVKAQPQSGPNVFIWQIVHSTTHGRAIEAASTDTYKTMYEAYAAGAAALKELVPMTTKRHSRIRSR